MLNPFDDVRGVRKTDSMTGAADVLPNVQANLIQQARTGTANVSVAMKPSSDCGVIADVTVENLTGHRLPSGVGFLRVFLEVNAVPTVHGRDPALSPSTHTNNVSA